MCAECQSDSNEAVLCICESQLVALEQETRLRFEKMANVAVGALDAAQTILDETHTGSGAGGSTELAQAIENLTMEFQFLDEYSQRLQHVREAIALIRANRDDAPDVAALVPTLSRIFTLHSEQGGLEAHLPTSPKTADDASPGSSVELF